MAITGEGTAANPYIVETWEDFISVADDFDVYIQCANDCIWDFNTIAPEGIQDIEIIFRSWDGNNVQIKNMAFVNMSNSTDHFGLKLRGDGTNLVEVKNVNFINFYVNNMYQYGTTNFLELYGPLQMKNCKFSGYIINGIIFYTHTYDLLQFINCSFNFNYRNQTQLCSSGYTNDNAYFNNCRLVFDGDGCNSIAPYSAKPTFNNCKISGKMPFQNWYFNANTSVIDTYTLDDVYLNFSGGYSNTIINSDKYTALSDLPEDLKQVTTAQMINISYLQSIGFPVVEV